MSDFDWIDNPSSKISFTYKISEESYNLLETISEKTGWSKNKVLDHALYDFAYKIKNINQIW